MPRCAGSCIVPSEPIGFQAATPAFGSDDGGTGGGGAGTEVFGAGAVVPGAVAVGPIGGEWGAEDEAGAFGITPGFAWPVAVPAAGAGVEAVAGAAAEGSAGLGVSVPALDSLPAADPAAAEVAAARAAAVW
jgi:hypothetical protein